MNKSKQHPLYESLGYKDLVDVLKPTLHVDEFASKMGDDDDVIVLSFFVRDDMASKDLMNWFEKGYDFVLDSDKSPGEIKPNRYLVFVEIRRRSNSPRNVYQLLNDLNTLTEYDVDDWTMHYKGKSYPFSEETFARLVPLSPKAYRKEQDEGLNEVRIAAGLDVKKIHPVSSDLRKLQAASGMI
jgi:hypothetical protein